MKNTLFYKILECKIYSSIFVLVDLCVIDCITMVKIPITYRDRKKRTRKALA